MGLVTSVSGPGLAAIYEVLLDANENLVEQVCDNLELEIEDLKWATQQYREKHIPFDGVHLALASWVVVAAGPRLRVSPIDFELSVEQQIRKGNASDRLVFPFWFLMAPVSTVRLPARPLVCSDYELELAYDGLLGHVLERENFSSVKHRELLVSSIVWRVSMIIERIAFERGNDLFGRIDWLCSQVEQHLAASPAEKLDCRVLEPRFAQRRNSLTHFNNNDHWDFCKAAQASIEDEKTVWDIISALSLGLACCLAEDLRQCPPTHAFRAIARDIDW